MTSTSTTDYRQCFWSVDGLSSGDIGADARTKISNATSQVQTDNADSILIATSCGGYFANESPEVALAVVFEGSIESFKETINSLTVSLNTALSDYFTDPNDPTVTAALQKQVRFFTLDQETINSFQESFSKQSSDRRRKLNGIASCLPAVAPEADRTSLYKRGQPIRAVVTTSAQDIPPHERSEGFSITTTLYDKLKTAEGDDLEDIIVGLQKSLTGIETETKTNAVALKLILGNIVTVGKKMWAAYGVAAAAAGSVPWTIADLSAIVPALISSTGGIIALSIVAGIIISAIATATILMKDATNLLLVVNGQNNDFALSEDSILNGDRRMVVMEIPALREDETLAHPAGFYVYAKRPYVTIKNLSGSTAGLAFKRTSDQKLFSIGVDCPNTILGGLNSVVVYANGQSASAASAADTSSKAKDSVALNPGTWYAARASGWGCVNYVVGLLEVDLVLSP